jgi:hypothetical protein
MGRRSRRRESPPPLRLAGTRADSPDPGPERGEGGRGRSDLSHRRPNRARGKASRRAARCRRSRRGEVAAVGGWARMRVGKQSQGRGRGEEERGRRRAGAGAKEGREAGPREGGAREEVRERGRRRGEEERGGRASRWNAARPADPKNERRRGFTAKCRSDCSSRWRRYSAGFFCILQMQHGLKKPLETILG